VQKKNRTQNRDVIGKKSGEGKDDSARGVLVKPKQVGVQRIEKKGN